MKEVLITFKTAKLAKKKGFNLLVNNSYNENKIIEAEIRSRDYNSLNQKDISAPTQSLLQKWLRENHKIHVLSTYHINSDKSIRWYWITIKERWYKSPTYSTYEDALEKGLKEGLKLLEDVEKR